MGLAIAGVIANWFGVLIVYSNSLQDYTYRMLLPYTALLATISVIGLIIAISNSRKIGGILIIIGSFIFIPLGLIGVFGGRRIMKGSVEDELSLKRKKLKDDNGLNLRK